MEALNAYELTEQEKRTLLIQLIAGSTPKDLAEIIHLEKLSDEVRQIKELL